MKNERKRSKGDSSMIAKHFAPTGRVAPTPTGAYPCDVPVLLYALQRTPERQGKHQVLRLPTHRNNIHPVESQIL